MPAQLQRGKDKGADQTVRMHSLVCAFVVRMQQNQNVSRRLPYLSGTFVVFLY